MIPLINSAIFMYLILPSLPSIACVFMSKNYISIMTYLYCGDSKISDSGAGFNTDTNTLN